MPTQKSTSNEKRSGTHSVKPPRVVSPVVGNLLRLIDASALTYEQVSYQSGYGANTVSRLRHHTFNPSILTVESLGQTIGYHLEWVPNAD